MNASLDQLCRVPETPIGVIATSDRTALTVTPTVRGGIAAVQLQTYHQPRYGPLTGWLLGYQLTLPAAAIAELLPLLKQAATAALASGVRN